MFATLSVLANANRSRRGGQADRQCTVMLVDDQQDAERTRLGEPAYSLNLDPEQQAHLEPQAKAGGEVA